MADGLDLTGLVAAPVTRTVRGVDLQLSPLTFRDLGRVTQWARDQIVRTVRDAVTQEGVDLTLAQATLMLDRAYKAAAQIDWTDASSDPECLTRLVWLSARHVHQELTLDQVDQLMTTAGSRVLNVLADEILLLSGMGAAPDDPSEGGAPDGDGKSGAGHGGADGPDDG